MSNQTVRLRHDGTPVQPSDNFTYLGFRLFRDWIDGKITKKEYDKWVDIYRSYFGRV